MLKSETSQQQTTARSVFRPPEDGGGTQRCQVSGVNDPEELQAEQTADQVMGSVFREFGGPASGSAGPGLEGGPAELASSDLAGPGSALPSGLQDFMSSSIGADFSNVRVHTDAGADRASQQLSARAFTQGQDVYFKEGEYDPSSREGQHLIAHELAHAASGADGLHRVVDINNITRPNELNENQDSEVTAFVSMERNKLTQAMTENHFDDMKKKYVSREVLFKDIEISVDKDKIEKMDGAVREAANLAELLERGEKAASSDKIKTAYRNSRTDLCRSINAVKDDVDKMFKKVNEEYAAATNATMPDPVKEMLLDPAFSQFRTAVEKLRAAGASNGFSQMEEDAAKNAAKMEKEASVSLQEKQEALGFEVEGGGRDRLSTAAKGFHAAGESVSAVSDNVGGVAGAVTDHVEGGRIEKKFAGDEEGKKEAEEEAANLSSERADAASGITAGVGDALSGVGGTLDTIQNSKEAEAQRKQDEQAKKSMRSIAAQLEHTIPGAEWDKASQNNANAQPQPRSQRIIAVCNRVKQSKFNKGEGSMSELISAAMETDANITPALTETQEKMLSTLQLLESSRASSKEEAKKMRKEAIFSSMDAFGSIMSSAGSLTSSIGSLLGSSAAGIVGAVLSLAGAIFGQIGAFREAMGSEDGEEDGTQKKMDASRGIIRQMAALPGLENGIWTNLDKKAKGEPGAEKASREHIIIAGQYAGVFHSIQAANVNISDILFAIQKGGFGEQQAGTNQTKSVADSMKDMYANLSFS